MDTKCLDFLSGLIPTNRGDYIHDILAWTDEKWEECHDHIQWCFPTQEKSMFNLDAPLLTFEEIAIVKDYKIHYENSKNIVCRNYYLLVRRFLRFLNIEIVSKINYQFEPYLIFRFIDDVVPANLDTFNHNYLRITRLLTSLNLFGLEDIGQSILDLLESKLPFPTEKERLSLEIWKDAACGYWQNRPVSET